MAHMVMRAKDDCISELYLACRAYWMWSLQPGDPLSNILTDFSVGEPLALSPDVLNTASECCGGGRRTALQPRELEAP